MDSDTAGLALSPDAYGGPVQAGSPMLVGPAYLSTMEPVQDEMLLSSRASGDLVHLLRDGQDGALRMTFNGMSPHYNDGEIVMGAAVDMEAAAAILEVQPEELSPVVAAAGRALGQARSRIEAWKSDGPPQALTYGQTKAIACGEQTVPPVHAGPQVAPMDAVLSAATASASEQLLAAGDGALSVSDPVLHLGAGSPSATITGPDGSLDLRVDRATGQPSVHLISRGFPQHGTSDPIDTQLGVNLGASVINVPDADLLAVLERAAPILDVAHGELDRAAQPANVQAAVQARPSGPGLQGGLVGTSQSVGAHAWVVRGWWVCGRGRSGAPSRTEPGQRQA